MTAAGDERRWMMFVAVMLLALACSATKITSEWRDESYLKKPGRILVLARMHDPGLARTMEDEITGRLKKAGTDAVAGHAVLPEGDPLNRQTIAAGMKELGTDAIFLIRLLDRRAEPEYLPGTGDPWYDFYGGFYSPYAPGFPPGGYPAGYPRVEFPGHTVVNVYDVTESSLLDAETGKLVWSAWSEGRLQDSDRTAIESYASQIVKSLRKQNLIG